MEEIKLAQTERKSAEATAPAREQYALFKHRPAGQAPDGETLGRRSRQRVVL